MYIMVTIWEHHWDQINNNRTRYTNNYINFDLENLQNDVDTIFIRIYTNNQTKRAWRGTISNIQRQSNETWFNIQNLSEINVPTNIPIYSSGWYLFNGTIETNIVNTIPNTQQTITPTNYSNDLIPPFFNNLNNTNDYRQFELYVPNLLRLVGLNEVYTNPPARQAGLPDGFFKIRNIEVIYDAKLNENYLRDCNQQITNYCNQLSDGNIRFGEINFTLNPDHDKYVWIITRGQTGYIRTVNNVMIKEISIKTLIKLYTRRLNECFHQRELENCIRNIENI